ncbi:cysteine hydrolase family protein [Kitasatospora sp. CM 4170]|uniref:Cysteine hydrolase family protein n=1 Tax=Kitasatospora aburaviensis TaxID=67265 RepID=A0ABW1FDR5_9ACTN|nr:cysteine hydrolase family protein [Kitasatospora sp. CM 4170]WNM48035.1 cysteine hydrolase family protein [Kitasatospora sp. CM 4170]
MTNTSAFDAPLTIDSDAVLIVIDVQKGFEDHAFWGERDNPEAEQRIGELIDVWEATGRPIVTVQHASAGGPLVPGTPGYELKDFVAAARSDLHITKQVNSAFYGTPDLHDWLQQRGARQVVITGIITNVCNETTARMAGNLGYDAIFPADAMHAFDMTGPDGVTVPAAELARATSTVLHAMRFAKVVDTGTVVAAAAAGRPAAAGAR